MKSQVNTGVDEADRSPHDDHGLRHLQYTTRSARTFRDVDVVGDDTLLGQIGHDAGG